LIAVELLGLYARPLPINIAAGGIFMRYATLAFESPN
jgi:hypothetical protein